MIIKTFKKDGLGIVGQEIESWNAWNEVEDVFESSKNAEKDHLSPFFKKYFPYPPKKILEGGCGIGKYVIAYRKLGYDILGVDFSGKTIRRVKKEIDSNLPLYEADITALPFEDGFFDCYYSGGVIEHFEEGPDAPLKEARRVLKKGGIFLVTVPFINFLRKLYFSVLTTKKKDGFLQKKCKKCQHDLPIQEGYKFSEYSFDINSLLPYFKDNDFVIEKTYPIDFLWGEIGLLLHKYIGRHHAPERAAIRKSDNNTENSEGAGNKKSFTKDLMRSFLITQDRDNIFLRIPVTLLNYLSGHMVLFVARAA